MCSFLTTYRTYQVQTVREFSAHFAKPYVFAPYAFTGIVFALRLGTRRPNRNFDDVMIAMKRISGINMSAGKAVVAKTATEIAIKVGAPTISWIAGPDAVDNSGISLPAPIKRRMVEMARNPGWPQFTQQTEMLVREMKHHTMVGTDQMTRDVTAEQLNVADDAGKNWKISGGDD